jgi:DNA polymerase-1
MITYIGNATTSQGYQYRKRGIDDVVKYCSDKQIIAVDTETNGLDFTSNEIIMLQIGDKDHQFVIDVRSTDISPLKYILEDREIVKVMHNVKFDYLFIKSRLSITMQNVYDTMLTEKVIHCGKNMRFGLKDLLKKHFQVEIDKNIRTTFNTDQPFTKEQIEYGAKDIEYLIKLKDLQEPLINKYKLNNTVELENKAVLAFADIEYNGLNIDKNKWKLVYIENKKQADKLNDKLDLMVLEDIRLQKFVLQYVQGDLFTAIKELRKVGINWDSPKQVLSVFKCILPDLENVNGKYLNKHRYRIPIINQYIKYKEAMKLCTSYGDAFFDNIRADGKIHTSFHQILDTGRVSSSKPNMQQIPADNLFRNCFIAPTDWKFVSADYSSQELNVIAFGSKDPVWIEALKRGEDLHSVCAELVYGDNWTSGAEDNCVYFVNKSKCDCPKHKSMRTNVKTINFGLAYGMGPHKLADTLNIPISDAKLLIKKYFASFPAIGGFLNKLANFGKKFGYIKTFPPYNRRRWFDSWYPNIWNASESKRELGSIERASKNTPIQGASADMTKLALILIREYIAITKCPVKIVMTVHDQIDTICHKDYLNEWTAKIKELMELAANKIVTNGLLKAEVGISDYWQK